MIIIFVIFTGIIAMVYHHPNHYHQYLRHLVIVIIMQEEEREPCAVSIADMSGMLRPLEGAWLVSSRDPAHFVNATTEKK